MKLRCEEREREICVDILALSVENVTDQRFAAQRSAAQISLPQNGVCRPDFPPSEPTEPGEVLLFLLCLASLRFFYLYPFPQR